MKLRREDTADSQMGVGGGLWADGRTENRGANGGPAIS